MSSKTPRPGGGGVSKGLLTRQELKTVGHFWAGLSNKEIAGRMGISERTVKGHLTNIYRKFGLGEGLENKRIALHKIIGFA